MRPCCPRSAESPPLPPTHAAAARTEAGEMLQILGYVAATLAVVLWLVVRIEQVAPDAAISATHATIVPVVVAEPNATAPVSEKAASGLVNGLVVASVFVAMAALTMWMVRRGSRRVLRAWLGTCSLLVYVFLAFVVLDLLCTSYQVAYDYATSCVVLVNFGVVGVIVVHYRGAEGLRRCYLVATAAILGWFLTKLPPWSTWILLALFATYDAASVLLSSGIVAQILRGEEAGGAKARAPAAADEVEMRERADAGGESDDGSGASSSGSSGIEYELPGYDEAQAQRDVEHSQEEARRADAAAAAAAAADAEAEDGAAPAVASADVLLEYSASGASGSEAGAGDAASHTEEEGGVGGGAEDGGVADVYDEGEEEDELQGLMFATAHHQLGLGDFVFYGLLVGRSYKSTDGDYLAVALSVHGVLLGLLVTLVAVWVTDRALPALPLPVLFGTALHFVAVHVERDYLLNSLPPGKGMDFAF